MPDPSHPGVLFDLHDRRGALTLDVAATLSPGWSVLFGPSGSGKTTLLRLLAGLDRPESGRILINSPAASPLVLTDTSRGLHIPPERRGVRLLAQRPALFPHRSVLGNLTYALRSQSKLPPAPGRLDEIGTLCGIASLLDRRPTTLSGGERQRVALARTLMAAPTHLLLLDEPFTGLGADARDALIHALRRWLEPQRIPILFVTHDLGEAFAVNGTVLRLEAGHIIATGSAATVLAPERDAMLDRLRNPPAQ